MKQLTFQSLCTQLKDHHGFNDGAEDLNTLIGAVSSLLGDASTDGFTSFIKALAEKDKLISLCGTVLQKILDQKPEDYSGRVDQMREAYGTLCFTAFFDELDEQLPDSIRKAVSLSLSEKKRLLEQAMNCENGKRLARMEIILPDIMQGIDSADSFLEETYRSLVQGIRTFTNGLSFRETASEEDIRTFDGVLESLPKNACRRFHSQYLILCGQFNEFYIFTQMEQQTQQNRKCDERYRTILSAAAHTQDSTEAGLASLEKIILNLPDKIKNDKVRKIADQIIRKYRGDINCPLIGTKDEEEADDNLNYPLISQGFIPQAYKLLKYSNKERLELPDTWKPLEPQQDMRSFWAKYCLDPGSTESLLLILGEPGGGKSLLTKVLCARMISPSSMFVRIPLRSHEVEDDIESIVCRQIDIDGDTSERVPTFKWFAEEFPDNPVTLLFDGYDEVLQATGGVYRNLLKKIHQFQDRCRELRRPVRVIVTSRETLIDKADIPERTIVMKLLEFDDSRKNQWISIWNEHNHNILSAAGIDDFSLPTGSRDIEELSGQPLLLLMLAMYDADFEARANALKPKVGPAEKLDRTKLYDELLRRFIRRELRKGPRGNERHFDEADESEQNNLVDDEMRKLGIAALGMFVREKLSLQVGELEHDLEYMRVKVPEYDGQNKRMLKSAEAFLGSFFFIHDSRQKSEPDEKEAAFEFLHKTFYEFLVADFILQQLLEAVDKMADRKTSRRNGNTFYLEDLERLDSFNGAYYTALGGACLCTEPEILQMAAEWKDRKLANWPSEIGSMVDQIMEDVFYKHMTMIRTGTFFPDGWDKGGLAGGHSVPQACAVYLLNLLILRVLFQGRCQIKREDWHFVSQFVRLNAPPPKKDSASPDDSPAFRENFLPSEEIILKFMALFQLRRENDDILIEKMGQVREFENQNLLEARISIFDFMQDAISSTVYKLHDTDVSITEKKIYLRTLCQEGFYSFRFEQYIAQLQSILVTSVPIERKMDIIKRGNVYLHRRGTEPSLVLEWLLCIQHLIGTAAFSSLPGYQEYKNCRPYMEYEHDVIEYFRSWEILRDAVFYRYIGYMVIVQTFLAIIKGIDYTDMLAEDPRFIESVVPKIVCYPKIFFEFLMVIIDAIPKVSTQEYWSIAHIIDRRIADVPSQDLASPKVATALLKLYSTARWPSYPNDRIQDLIRVSLDQSYYYPPEDLPELLRVCLQTGGFQEVRDFFSDLPKDWIRRLLDKHPDVVTELFDIARTVRRDQAFKKYIIPWMRKWPEKVSRYPDVFIKVVLHSIQNRKDPEYKNADAWMARFLAVYREIFCFNMEDAVYVLYLIYEHGFFWEKLESACVFSLLYYPSVLEKSVRTAARLLTMFEKMSSSRKQMIKERTEGAFIPARSIELCFNKAISIRDRDGIPQLEELLDHMGAEEKEALNEYFTAQEPYLRAYSTRLAKKVKEIYHGSDSSPSIAAE